MLALATNQDRDDHETRSAHPEQQARLRASLDGLMEAGLSDAVLPVESRPATTEQITRVHDAAYIERLEAFCRAGGGSIDADTDTSPGSWTTAVDAAGAGIAVVEELERGTADAGLVLVRPPGHHALADRAMGFCLLNNIAITAAALADRGERVLIVDWDVHHGNGTQDAFWTDDRVLFVSIHQDRLYPGTGHLEEMGAGKAFGLTMNLPLPPGTTGDAMLRALDQIVAPSVERFRPTWVLASAGFDGHRDDPLADFRLTSGDFADIAGRVTQFAPARSRTVLFLEGGYNLGALRASVGAAAAASIGESYRPEVSTSGGTATGAVDAAVRWWRSF
jgi:acetoin utilization deacetylase AcuC-like enzyme